MRTIRGTLIRKVDDKIINPSRKEIWNAVLASGEAKTEFPALTELYRNGIPVAGLIAEIITFAHKGVHTGRLRKVLLDTDNFSEVQVDYIISLSHH